MKKLVEIIGVIDAFAFIAGIIYLLVQGSLPQTVTDAWNEAQTVALILITILAIPVIVLAVLIVQSQLAEPYEGKSNATKH